MHRQHRAVNIMIKNMVVSHPKTCGRPYDSFSPCRLTFNHSLNRQNACFRLAAHALMCSIMQQWTKKNKLNRCCRKTQFHSADKVCLTQYKSRCHSFLLCCAPARVCYLFIRRNEEGTYHHRPFHNLNQQSSHYTIYLQEEFRLMKLKCSVSWLLPVQTNYKDKLEDYGKHNEYICYLTTCPRQKDTIGTPHTIGRHVSPPQTGHSLYFSASTCRNTLTAKERYAFGMQKQTEWCRSVVKDTNGTQDTNGTPSPPQPDRSHILVNWTQSLSLKHSRVLETQDITRRRQEDTTGRHYTTGTPVLTKQRGKQPSYMGKHDGSPNAILTQDTNGSQDTTGTPQVKPAAHHKRLSNAMIQSYMPPGSTHIHLNLQPTNYKLVTRSNQETKLSKLEKTAHTILGGHFKSINQAIRMIHGNGTKQQWIWYNKDTRSHWGWTHHWEHIKKG
jgi:hypothetical protein